MKQETKDNLWFGWVLIATIGTFIGAALFYKVWPKVKNEIPNDGFNRGTDWETLNAKR